MSIKRVGVVLAGGKGTRLAPCTDVISKQMLPVYDKPMICYPISTLWNFDIDEIMIISSAEHIDFYREFLKGKIDTINFSYAVQDEPNGIAEAYLIAEDFIDSRPSVLILGDNVFTGGLIEADAPNCVYLYSMVNPSDYGVPSFSGSRIKQIYEKPAAEDCPSKFAVTGLYMLDGNAPYYAKEIEISTRGELEITDLLNIYANKQELTYKKLTGEWFDCGTPDRLLDAANYVSAAKRRNGFITAAPF